MATSGSHDTVCAICQDDFQDPVFIQCFHTFCRPCIGELISQNFNHRQFRCPVCKEINTLPESGVAGLKRNFYIQKIRDADLPPYPVCERHTFEDLRFYCLKCNVTACRDCKVIGHGNHKFESVDTVAEIMRIQLKDFADAAQKNLKRYAVIDDKLHSIRNGISKQRHLLIAKCYQQADEMKSLIDTLAKNTENAITNTFKSILQTYERKSQHVLTERNKLECIMDSVSELTKNTTSNFDIVSNFKLVSELDHSFDKPVKDAELVNQNYQNVFRVGKPNARELQGMLGEVQNTRELQDNQTDVQSDVDSHMTNDRPINSSRVATGKRSRYLEMIEKNDIFNIIARIKERNAIYRSPRHENYEQKIIPPSNIPCPNYQNNEFLNPQSKKKITLTAKLDVHPFKGALDK